MRLALVKQHAGEDKQANVERGLRALDLFQMTNHVECVATFDR